MSAGITFKFDAFMTFCVPGLVIIIGSVGCQAFLTKGPLGEVQAGQVISFGAGLLVTEHQLTSVPAAETLVVRLLLSLRFPLFILSLHPLPFWLGCVAVGVLQRTTARQNDF